MYKDMIQKIDIKDASIAEEIRKNMKVATPTDKGLALAWQNPISYNINAGETIDIELPAYGIYLFVSEIMSGSGFIFQKAFSVSNFKILMDASNVIGTYFSLSLAEDGSKIVRVKNLSPTTHQRFSINRI